MSGSQNQPMVTRRKPPRGQIVFVNRFYDPDQSATSQMLTDLARGLAVKGIDVAVVASRQLYGESRAQLPAFETLFGVRVHRIATTRFGRAGLWGRAVDYGSFYLACAFELLKLVRYGDVVVAKTDPPLLSILIAPIARVKRATLINWQQDVFPEIATHLGVTYLPGFFDKLIRRLRDSSLNAATMNVAIGARMREYLASRGVPGFKLCVIENWADSRLIRPKNASTSALRSRLDVADRFVVCYSGNLGRAHDFDTLLETADCLREDPRFVFLIIGDGAKMATLKRGVEARALQNFRLLPYQPRDTLEDSLAAADVHLVSLLPAVEGLIVPSKLYGILAAGRPLIFVGDPDGELSRIIARARCGLSIALGDSRGLADALRAMASDPARISAMGLRARRLLCEDYCLRHAIDRWMALLKAVSQVANVNGLTADTHTNPAPKTGIP